MRFVWPCSLCGRNVSALSMEALRVKACAHFSACADRAKDAENKRAIANAQPSLPFGGDA